MKRFKKLISLAAAAAALCTALPLLPSLKADAEESSTFYVKYDTDMQEWRVQSGGDKWNDEDAGRELYYLNNGDNPVKDGGVVVILPNSEDATGGKEITINAHLSNLTINRADAAVRTGGVDNCYVFGDSYAAVNGDVSNAYVYDNAICTFNNNVTNLNLLSSSSNTIDSSVSVGGTVAYALLKNPGDVIAEYYNFAANSFYYNAENGLLTDDSLYSKTGSGAVATPAVTAASAAAPAANTTTAAGNSGYDDVPKTGESNPAAWLLTLSALSLAGCLITRKRSVTE